MFCTTVPAAMPGARPLALNCTLRLPAVETRSIGLAGRAGARAQGAGREPEGRSFGTKRIQSLRSSSSQAG
jgi:hypothetical protein